MSNVLFVNIPAIPWNELKLYSAHKNTVYTPLAMPMGILYLSACVKEKFGNQHNVQLLDYCINLDKIQNFPNDIEHFFLDIAIKNVILTPDIISITLNFACVWKTTIKCIDSLSKIYPNASIVVGGIQASNSIMELKKHKNINYIVWGEGDCTFPHLIEKISQNELMPRVIKSEMPQNIDNLPYPDWSILDMEKYTHTSFGWGGKSNKNSDVTATIQTTRGCPYHCTFCSAHSIHGRKIRSRSIENVIGEIKELHTKFCVNTFTFADDMFTADKNRTKEMIRQIQALGIPNIKLQFPDYLSINAIDEEIIDLLISCGMEVASFAIESGSEYTQWQIIKKNVNLKKARSIIKYVKNKYPEIIVRCIFIFGFPHETLALMRESINYAKSLDIDWTIINTATPLPGSEMFKQYVEMGVITDSPKTWNKCHYGFGSRWFDTPEHSAKELNNFIYLANLDVNFKNNYNIRHGNFYKALQQFEGIVLLYDFHIIGWYCILFCYEKLGDTAGIIITKNKIKQLLESDERAITMYQKYRQFIPE